MAEPESTDLSFGSFVNSARPVVDFIVDELDLDADVVDRALDVGGVIVDEVGRAINTPEGPSVTESPAGPSSPAGVSSGVLLIGGLVLAFLIFGD